MLFIDSFLDNLINKLLIFIFTFTSLKEQNKSMFDNLIKILDYNLSFFENYILINETSYLIGEELSFVDLSLAISLHKAF